MRLTRALTGSLRRLPRLIHRIGRVILTIILLGCLWAVVWTYTGDLHAPFLNPE